MKRLNKEDWFGESGIYGIQNRINGKIYIGKSNNIYYRLKAHTTHLNRRHKDENPHLINAWHKYGEENFEYFVLEYCDKEDLDWKELYWMDKFDVLDNSKGYNIRYDSLTKGCQLPEETKEKMSKSNIEYWENISDEEYQKRCDIMSEMWKNNPEAKKRMAEKVSKAKTKYAFIQKDKETEEFIRKWDSMREIMNEHPDWHKQSIYSVAGGWKNSYRGYKWEKVLKR